MKKKYPLFIALIITLGVAISGCYVNKGYYSPHHYHHTYHHRYHNHHY